MLCAPGYESCVCRIWEYVWRATLSQSVLVLKVKTFCPSQEPSGLPELTWAHLCCALTGVLPQSISTPDAVPRAGQYDPVPAHQRSKSVSLPKQKEVQPGGPGCWKSQSQQKMANHCWEQGINNTWELHQEAFWPASRATSELLAQHGLLSFSCTIWSQTDLARQEKVWALWPSRWKRKCVGWRRLTEEGWKYGDPELLRHCEVKEPWGVWWEGLGKGQGRPSMRTVQIAGQKMCLYGRDVLKSTTQCHKTKPPTMLLVERGHCDNSRKQAWKQQSSQASAPWVYTPEGRHTYPAMGGVACCP